jgi:hypothetical protein
MKKWEKSLLNNFQTAYLYLKQFLPSFSKQGIFISVSDKSKHGKKKKKLCNSF